LHLKQTFKNFTCTRFEAFCQLRHGSKKVKGRARNCKFPTEKIMGAQNYAPKFS